MMVKVGQKVRFKLFDETEFEDGVVHFIHPTNHWFNVEYGGEEGRRLISFNFMDIGRTVRLDCE